MGIISPLLFGRLSPPRGKRKGKDVVSGVGIGAGIISALAVRTHIHTPHFYLRGRYVVKGVGKSFAICVATEFRAQSGKTPKSPDAPGGRPTADKGKGATA